MCTVTYIPTRGGFHLTSNRDEHISRRQALPPMKYTTAKNVLLYPRDTDKDGSWIAAKDNGDLIVLLNGAFVKHLPQPPYKKSRGLVLTEIINAALPEEYFKSINLDAIEPFTIILYADGNLYEGRWDGEKKHVRLLDNQRAYIWSSATLYDKTGIARRKSWFKEWRWSEPFKTTADILHFHNHCGQGDIKDGLVIDRDGMITRSITSLWVTQRFTVMTYQDLQDKKLYTSELSIIAREEKYRRITARPFYLSLKRFSIRLLNWEYWPFNVIYAPILFYWFWLSFKSRSIFFFNTANPLIKNGGFVMESKWLIYELIPKQYSPLTLLFQTGTDMCSVLNAINHNRLKFPMIAKPDIGSKGVLVKKVHNENELADYIDKIKVEFLLQAYIEYKNEIGIFYYRIPGEEKGRISGMVGKEFLKVTGDGKSTITELIIKEPRSLLQLPVLKSTYGDLLQMVLNSGEEYMLVPYGNHARGARFIDLSYLVTDQLTRTIDHICRQIPGFYFGRMDVMYNNWEELCAGENFSIVELNGAGSEPTHIYDPAHSIFFAWKEIIRHLKLLNQISAGNQKKEGLRYMTYREGIAMLKNNARYLKLVS